MRANIYEFLATGFEEIEALTPVTVMRQGGQNFKLVSMTGNEYVETANRAWVKADMLFEASDFSDADLLMLPGGFPGAYNLKAHEGLHHLLLNHATQGKRIGAICAAPIVLGELGLLKGRRATCWPSLEHFLEGANVTGNIIEEDGNIITAIGASAALSYAFKLLSYYLDEEKLRELQALMCYDRVSDAFRSATLY